MDIHCAQKMNFLSSSTILRSAFQSILYLDLPFKLTAFPSRSAVPLTWADTVEGGAICINIADKNYI